MTFTIRSWDAQSVQWLIWFEVPGNSGYEECRPLKDNGRFGGTIDFMVE
jgi:hypothetical protein